MEENKTDPQLEQTTDSKPVTKLEKDTLSDDQLEDITGGTAVPVHKLEDVDNQTIDRPVDIETT